MNWWKDLKDKFLRPKCCSLCGEIRLRRELTMTSSYFLIAYQYGRLIRLEKTGKLSPEVKEGKVPSGPWPSGVYYCEGCKDCYYLTTHYGFGVGDSKYIKDLEEGA